MVMLTDVDTVKVRLRIDQDVEDDDLELMIMGASASVLNYLKLAHDFYDDSNGNPQGVPDEIVNATILLVGILSRDRDGQEADKWTQGYLPTPVVSLLYCLRDPAVA